MTRTGLHLRLGPLRLSVIWYEGNWQSCLSWIA
jgi:hypothetical protein